MKQLLAVLFLTMLFCPVQAQNYIPQNAYPNNNVQNYQMITIPPQSHPVVVLNQQPQGACNPPQGFIGKSVNALNGRGFNNPVRIIHPGEMVTMDYTPNRLNIIVDQNGIIRDMHCG